MPDCIAIVSGGLDSVTLLHYLVKKERRQPAVRITFQYGQKHHQEIICAQYHADLLACQPHLLLDLNHLSPLFAGSALVSAEVAIPQIDEVLGDPQPATYVPNRNMIFLALAAAFAETNGVADIYYGAQRHDIYGYWDTTPQFLNQLNQVYQLNRKTAIAIQAPFVHRSKAEIVRLGIDLGVDYGHTWSCYAGGEAACGLCPTCAERRTAFDELGLTDPVPYQTG